MKIQQRMATNTMNPLGKLVDKGIISQRALSSIQDWLAEQMLAHEFAKLGQGGHTNTQVPLGDVFVDLPVADSPSSVPADEIHVQFLENSLKAKSIELKTIFGRRLPTSPNRPTSEDERDENSGSSKYEWSFTLLVGGPGQGKSTLGQLACQLYRASLLLPLQEELTGAQRDLVKSLTGKHKGRRWQGPAELLFPLQLSLPDLAAWLANDSEASEQLPAIIRYLGNLPSAAAAEMTPALLMLVCKNLPIYLVLDGFDEVGATQDRLRSRTCEFQFPTSTKPQR